MQFTQKPGKYVQVGLTLAAGIALVATALRPQQLPAVGPVWEYASVTGTPAMVSNNGGRSFEVRANICYAGTNGCRSNEQVSSESRDGREIGDAIMSAAAKLGERGWELAAASDASGDNRHDRTLYFKRLRSVLNKSDSR